MPVIIVDDRFVIMTPGPVLSCELHGRDSGHIVYCLCAIQCGNPEPEIFHYLQAGRVHRVEQRRKVITVTVDNSRVVARKCRSPLLSPDGTLARCARVTFPEGEPPGLSGGGRWDVDRAGGYPKKSGEFLFRG